MYADNGGRAVSNTEVVSSNACVRLFCVCAVLCVGNGFATGSSPVKGVIQTVYRIKKLKRDQGPNKGLYSN
jgi:hypothetical protein